MGGGIPPSIPPTIHLSRIKLLGPNLIPDTAQRYQKSNSVITRAMEVGVAHRSGELHVFFRRGIRSTQSRASKTTPLHKHMYFD